MKNRIKLLTPVLFMLLSLFCSCSISDDEREEVSKILKIREGLLNQGKINSLEFLLTDDFENRKKYVEQLQYQHIYFTEYEYKMDSVDFVSYSAFPKSAEVRIKYNLLFRIPDSVGANVWISRVEKLKLKREKIGWKIASIADEKESGQKVDAQTTHDIFKTLDARVMAYGNGDYELFRTLFSNDFKKREKYLQEFKENSEAFGSMIFKINGRRLIYFSEENKEARVVQSYDMILKMKESEKAQKIEKQKEIITLKKSPDGEWLIAGLN